MALDETKRPVLYVNGTSDDSNFQLPFNYAQAPPIAAGADSFFPIITAILYASPAGGTSTRTPRPAVMSINMVYG